MKIALVQPLGGDGPVYEASREYHRREATRNAACIADISRIIEGDPAVERTALLMNLIIDLILDRLIQHYSRSDE